MEPLYLFGCRHDVLGHYLKAIGLLRVLAKCADKEHRDPDAEGWWDCDKACFCLRSTKYPTQEKLAEFFASHYQPTPLFSAWNKDTGTSASVSESFRLRADWEIANDLSSRFVSAEDRKKPENRDKLSSTEALEFYRDKASAALTEAMDSICVPFLKSSAEHPLFLSKGIAGRAHIWRTYWKYLADFQKQRIDFANALKEINAYEGAATNQLAKLKKKVDAALQKITRHASVRAGLRCHSERKRYTLFPDAIKIYNIGSRWVTESFRFNALDYVLAVEGGFSQRGSVGRTLAANSRRFAAFPFVFDAGEELVDDSNNVKGTSSALWFPLWDRPVTFAELSSYITDAQARLSGKEARFSAEFMRALNNQGADAGFIGWQEFRFKMKASRVPWITTGAHIDSAFREDATRLNLALHPLDESHFLDQFEIKWKGGKVDSKSPHLVRSAINAAMETATRQTTPHHCLDLLCTVFSAFRQMAISEAFRKTLPGERARFFRSLPVEHWNHLLLDMNEPEFRIARAVASISGNIKEREGENSRVPPMLGSLLPLKLALGGVWYLPQKLEDPSNQAVWTGTDVCHDLAAVLARRYMDSLKDDRPALTPSHSSLGARLNDVLAFLKGELDDQLISRWVEALSLIGWDGENVDAPAHDQLETDAIPPEYAAMRTLIELECERRDEGDMKKRRSHQPIALLCQRSATTLPLAVKEALRWVAIWGVPNPDRHQATEGNKRLAGRDIISLTEISPSTDAARLAAAVCIPLHWRDRNALYRSVSLPQTSENSIYQTT